MEAATLVLARPRGNKTGRPVLLDRTGEGLFFPHAHGSPCPAPGFLRDPLLVSAPPRRAFPFMIQIARFTVH